jgi:hypothetical protein
MKALTTLQRSTHPIVIVLAIGAAHAMATEQDMTPIDLQPKANQKLSDNFHNDDFEGNNLEQLPKGESLFEGVKFKIDEKLIQLGCKYIENKPDKVEGVEIGKKFNKLFILHATGFGAFGNPGDPLYVNDSTAIGKYTVRYEDKSEVIIPIVYGEDVRDWFNHDTSKPVTRGKVVWEGENAFSRQFSAKLRLYRTEWKNPHPDKKVVSIDFEREGDSPAAPFCVAMTIATE